jgi:hypothetical protein
LLTPAAPMCVLVMYYLQYSYRFLLSVISFCQVSQWMTKA